MPTALISAALELGTEVMKKINTEASRKLINDVKNKRLELLEEEGEGYTSNDAKVEKLYAELSILIQAMTAEFQLNAVK